MSRPPRTVIEYRNYELPADFPIQMLSGENWRISDVRAAFPQLPGDRPV